MYATIQKQNGINGYNWYTCTCCPYGYHIDLDFVRYCQSISQESKHATESIKRRRNRRRQRKSMEVLLGTIQHPYQLENNKIHDDRIILSLSATQKNQHNGHSNNFAYDTLSSFDGFDDAISDFERTLQRSKHKLIISNNYHNDTTSDTYNSKTVSPSSTSIHSGSSMTIFPINRDFDIVNSESINGLNAFALQNVREQMVLSLQKTRQLEDQLRILPQLKDQVTCLKNENRRLLDKLVAEEALRYSKTVKQINTNHSFDEYNKNTRDSSTMCNVMITRNVSVGQSKPFTRNVSTTTNLNLDTDLNRMQFLTRQEKFTQTLNETDTMRSIGVGIHPNCSDFSIQKNVECKNIATSDHTLNDLLCDNCRILNKNLDEPNNGENQKTFAMLRSKTFHLGQSKNLLENNVIKSRTIGCQCDIVMKNRISKSSQCELKQHCNKTSQCCVKQLHKTTQYKYENRSYDSNDKRSIGCNTIGEIVEKKCEKCQQHREKDESSSNVEKKLDSPIPSRIPRPHTNSTTSPYLENRKMKRQNTYTKVFHSDNNSHEAVDEYDESKHEIPLGLSGLNLSSSTTNPIENPITASFPNELKNSNIIKIDDRTNTNDDSEKEVNTVGDNVSLDGTSSLSGHSSNSSTEQQRKKALPCREMLGAMKVLNDLLQKNQSKKLKNNSAVSIIQQEWFKISSLATANPHDVDDYLDAFEELSTQLLEFIVNLTDDSGNTAMHYAVSHGNFDVVSILLDSKVCDINKMNKAGYTCIMLVSLAKIRSTTHANVVKRLFQIGDVNIKAKQHGQTALMLAVSHGRLDMVKMLINAGADINIQDEDGSTALMCASEHGHIDIVKYFLSQPDCNSNITDVDGSTALKIAMEAGHRHIGVLLYSHERNIQITHSLATGKKLNTTTTTTTTTHKYSSTNLTKSNM